MSRPLNYTTKIPTRRTASEVLDLLAEAGADHVSIELRDKEPVGVVFTLDTAGGRRDFVLPVDGDAMYARLGKARAMGEFASLHASVARLNQITSRANALNVAWRVVRDWLEAQLALIQAGMANLDQVMLPYLEVEPGESLYDRYLAREGRIALEGARP